MKQFSLTGCRLAALGLLCIAISLTACQSPQERASRELAQELEQRQQRQDASLRRYATAMQAYRAGDLVSAGEILREAVQLSDRNVAAWNGLGVVAFHKGDVRVAAEAFRRAARLAPDSYESYFNLGTVLESIGRYPEAIAEYEAALALAPAAASDLTEVRENLVRAYIRGGTEPARALELIRLALPQENRPEWRRWLELEAIRLEHQLNPAPPEGAPEPPSAITSSDEEAVP